MKVKRVEVDELDIRLGAKVREIRLARDITLNQVSERLGLTYQQIQKYESGANRIAASTLLKMAYIMDVPVTAFLAGMPDRDPKRVYPDVSLEIIDLKNRIDMLDPKLIGPIRHLVDMIIETRASK